MPDDVFVSYASEDRAQAAELVRRLEREGFSVWWDREIALGQSFHRAIAQALDEARCVIVLWTPASVGADWVINEASFAREKGVLVPVSLGEVPLPLAFRHLQTADLGAQGEELDAAWRRLIERIRQLVSVVPAAAGADTAGPMPQDLGRPTDRPSARASAGQGATGRKAALAALLAVSALLVGAWVGWGGVGRGPAPERGPAQASASAPDTATLTPTGAGPNPSASQAAAPQAPAGPEATPSWLDPAHGAELLAASEEAWRELLQAGDLRCTVLNAPSSFATVGLRAGRGALIDTLAVYVEASDAFNLRTLSLWRAEAEAGPYTLIGRFEVPNHRNMRTPLHAFKFPAVRARLVKLVAEAYQEDRTWGRVCSVRLHGDG